MTDAVNLVLEFWNQILPSIPNSPFMFLIALAIVLTIVNNIFYYLLNIGGK